MKIGKQEILDSGLLELYVLGELNDIEEKEVLKALKKYPDLKAELKNIEDSLIVLAKKAAVEPGPGVLENILASLPKDDPKQSNKQEKPSPKWPYWLFAVAALSALAFAFWQQSKYQQINQNFENLKVECESLKKNHENQIALYNNINDFDNQIIRIRASENFQESRITCYLNTKTRKNYLEIKGLPKINANETFQLWSLKDGVDPIPLNLIENELDNIMEVDYVEGSNAYAITIEENGGANTPNLDKLIGIFSI